MAPRQVSSCGPWGEPNPGATEHEVENLPHLHLWTLWAEKDLPRGNRGAGRDDERFSQYSRGFRQWEKVYRMPLIGSWIEENVVSWIR